MTATGKSSSSLYIEEWDFTNRSSHPEVFLRKGVLKICSKFTGEQPYWSVISIKLLCNFIEITLCHECSPVDLLHVFRTPLPKNTPGRLHLKIIHFAQKWNHENVVVYVCCCGNWTSLYNTQALLLFTEYFTRNTKVEARRVKIRVEE